MHCSKLQQQTPRRRRTHLVQTNEGCRVLFQEVDQLGEPVALDSLAALGGHRAIALRVAFCGNEATQHAGWRLLLLLLVLADQPAAAGQQGTCSQQTLVQVQRTKADC